MSNDEEEDMDVDKNEKEERDKDVMCPSSLAISVLAKSKFNDL